MHEIQRILDRLGALSCHHDQVFEDLEKLWGYGVEPIRDARLKEALVSFLTEKVPPGFFALAATRSGEYHPVWHNGRCGILKNTWECCLLIPPLALCFPGLVRADRTADPEAIDVALAATIASDTFKWSHDGVWNGGKHLMLAAEAWNDHIKTIGLDTYGLAARTLNGILWHHGVFSPGWKPGMQLSDEHLLVHVADSIMAQRFHAGPLHPEI